ncbi:hypothetical protein QM996_02475 [Sinorhizobium chiapasense]
MPVGTELAQLIRKSALIKHPGSKTPSVGDDAFYYAFRRLWPNDHPDHEAALKAALMINEGVHTAVSIDAFIDRLGRKYPLVDLIGKMLIALEISKAEAQSSLSLRYWPQFMADSRYSATNAYDKKLVNPDDTWLGQFFRILCDGVDDPQKIGNNITIICFNYDRCIELYLRSQIAAAYHIDVAEADEIVRRIKIIHPYGTLGGLPLIRNEHGDDVLVFGASNDHTFRLEKIAKHIKTYTERQHEPKMIEDIHSAIAHNNVLVFLGFGFNNQNLDLLRIPSEQSEHGQLESRPIYSSGYGIAKQVETTLKRRILHLLWPDEAAHEGIKQTVKIEFGQSCSELFRTHSMNLSSFSRSYFVENHAEKRAQRVMLYERGDD